MSANQIISKEKLAKLRQLFEQTRHTLNCSTDAMSFGQLLTTCEKYYEFVESKPRLVIANDEGKDDQG